MSDLKLAKLKLSETVSSMNPQLVCRIPAETTNTFFQPESGVKSDGFTG
jgi:hypothetical protein